MSNTQPSPVNRPGSMPIYQASGWIAEDLAQADRLFDGQDAGAVYATLGGVPNQVALEDALGRLHGAAACVATSGGMAALSAVFRAHLAPGRTAVVSRDLFGLTSAHLSSLERWGVRTLAVDTTDVRAVEEALGDDASLLLVETISNPLTRVADLDALAARARSAGALFVVDNTFAGPHHCRPLRHGADLVVESVTKSLAGHHDAVLGAVLGSEARVAPVRESLRLSAGFPAPFVAWLGQRGLATYELRQPRSAASAESLAEWFGRRPEVQSVFYPGLADHANHATAARILTNGFGATFSFELGGGRPAVERFLHALPSIPLLMSLGGTSTTLSHPGSSSHRRLSPSRRERLGISDGLLRLAVGLEPVEALRAELAEALRASRAPA